MSFGSILRANYTETLGRAGRDHEIGNRIFFDRNLLRQSVLVQLRQSRPPAIFLRFEMSADERILAVQNSVFGSCDFCASLWPNLRAVFTTDYADSGDSSLISEHP
jgi:hypothetical protein